jgi:hypothetical protein
VISDYFRDVELRIRNAEIIADKKADFSEFGPNEGMLRGRLLFVDGSMLEFMEYLHKERRLKYRFHLIDKEGQMIFRYDNAPHHKHIADSVVESEERGIMVILSEVEHLICKSI